MARRNAQPDTELGELVFRHGHEIHQTWESYPYAVLVRSAQREMVFGLERALAEHYARFKHPDPFLAKVGACVREHASSPRSGLPLFVLRQRGRRNAWKTNVLHSIFLSRGGDA